MDESKLRQIFSDNLKRQLELHGKQPVDLVNDLHVPFSTVSNWINAAKFPRMGKIEMLARYLGIEKSDLIEEKKPDPCRIPVLGRVAAGVPLEMVEDVIDWEEISSAVADSGEIFALSVKGDSMEPRILDGDVVIIRKQDDAESGDIVIASVNGDDATCKRLRKYREGIELIPLNSAYAPVFFSNQEIAEKPVRILGKVIELRGKF